MWRRVWWLSRKQWVQPCLLWACNAEQDYKHRWPPSNCLFLAIHASLILMFLLSYSESIKKKKSSCVHFLCLWFNSGPSFSLKLLDLSSFDALRALTLNQLPFLPLWNHSFISISFLLLPGSFVTNRSCGFRRLKIKSRQKCILQSITCLNKVNKLQGIKN